jgi:hypothetical protein
MNDREKRGKTDKDPDTIPVRTCRQCLAVYESYVHDCPYCGWIYSPDARRTVEQVEGDLCELDSVVLAAMRGEIDRIDAPDGVVGDKLRHAGAPTAAIHGAMKNHRLRQEAQAELREIIALWAGYARYSGAGDRVIMKMFYNKFGIDIMSAQALGRSDAYELKERIHEAIK